MNYGLACETRHRLTYEGVLEHLKNKEIMNTLSFRIISISVFLSDYPSLHKLVMRIVLAQKVNGPILLEATANLV